MKEKTTQDAMLAKIAAELDASANELDGATQSALTQTRYRALAAGRAKRSQYWRAPIAIAGATGAVAAVALLISSQWVSQPTAPIPDAVADFELLASSEDLELLEDLEFFEWLGTELGTG